MASFLPILANTLLASLTNNSIWFAVTFWAYLQTKSVVVTSVMAGLYLTIVAGSGIFLGALVDRVPKKRAMQASSVLSLALYVVAATICATAPANAFHNLSSVPLWAVIVISLLGAIAGNIKTIAMPTLVSILIPEENRSNANGLVGAANGVSFLCASIISGLVIGFLGIQWMLQAGIVVTALALAHLAFIKIPEAKHLHSNESENAPQSIDIKGTIRAVTAIPGLSALILYSTFNNFLGGIFFALMDAYGLQLVSVQVWGGLWGVLSLGVIIGGLVVSRTGLGSNPLRILMLFNIVCWAVCAVFTLRASIVLLGVGCFIFMCLMPVIEAAEQTIMQRVIPYERQGRVFGFAQSIEQAASPLTAFLIGPLTQFIFIPFMTTGAGPRLLPWFGAGTDRGIALVFTIGGIAGLILTIIAMSTRAYRALADYYRNATPKAESKPLQPTF